MFRPLTLLSWILPLAAGAIVGCNGTARVYEPQARPIVDRRVMEYPAGLEMTVVAGNLTAAAGVAVAPDGTIYVAEGERGEPVRLLQIQPDGTKKVIYPNRPAFDIAAFFGADRLRLLGPVGGLAYDDGTLFLTHADEAEAGVVTAFDVSGELPQDGPPSHWTVAADLPAMGDFGMGGIAVHPTTGRVYFGVGAATNSGVVGLDNWDAWVQRHPNFHDQPLVPLKLFGYRFDTPNPNGGLLGDDKVNTAPFNPFGQSSQRVAPARDGRPTGAIYSARREGGDLRVEAHGLHMPRGLAFNAFGNLLATNNGMELRGTRPVKDDPDALVRVPLAMGFGPVRGGASAATYFGGPDYSADMVPITDRRFQPPVSLISKTGYPELSFLIDMEASGLLPPDRATLLQAIFPSLSGAAGLTVVPEDAEGFSDVGSGYGGDVRGDVVVALRGDRAPFATSGLPLVRPVGYQVALVDLDTKTVRDFVRNTKGPGAENPLALDRPVDVAFGPDGAMYILDGGEMWIENGVENWESGTGKLYRLGKPLPPPTTQPATEAVEENASFREEVPTDDFSSGLGE